MFTTVEFASPQHTEKSASFVFWFLAPWARVGASCIAQGIRVLVSGLNRRVTGH
jgi:hypothetical protein